MKSTIKKSVIIITILLWLGVAVNYRAIADSYSKKSKENTKKQENISKAQPGESDQRKNELIKLGLDEKTVEKVLEVESEIKEIKCDYKELEKYYYEYYIYFTNSPEERWDVVQKKHTCNEVLSRIITFEKNIYQPHFTFLPVKNGFGEKPVVLYGKIVFPPYEIKYDDDAIKAYLNGVQIIPALTQDSLPKTQYEIENPSISELQRQLEKAEKAYRERLIKILRTEALDQFKNHGYTKKEALSDLKSYLKQFKQGFSIVDFWIYDEEQFLFDIKLVYSYPNWPNVPFKMHFTSEEWEKIVKNNPDYLLTEKEREIKEKKSDRKRMREHIEVIIDCTSSDNKSTVNIYYNASRFPNFGCYLYIKDLKQIAYIIIAHADEWKKVIYMNRLDMGVMGDLNYTLYNTDKSSALRFIQTNSN